MEPGQLKVLDPMKAGDTLHALTMQDLKRNPKLSYREAQERTFKINPELVRWYAGLPEVTSLKKVTLEAAPIEDVDAEVQKRMNAARAKDPHLTLSEARYQVLDADPVLKVRYAGYPVNLDG